jgi:hypothetical protein
MANLLPSQPAFLCKLYTEYKSFNICCVVSWYHVYLGIGRIPNLYVLKSRKDLRDLGKRPVMKNAARGPGSPIHLGSAR